jgi:hypothetical protein
MRRIFSLTDKRIALLNRYAYLALLLLAYVLASSSVEHSFLQKWRTLNSKAYSFQQFMDYEVRRPFAYRILVPGLVNLLYSSDAIRGIVQNEGLISRGACLYGQDQSIADWSLELQAKYILTGFVMFLFLLTAMFALRGITRHFFQNSSLSDVGPLLFALFLPLSFKGSHGFMYDFPELGLYFIGLYFLLRSWNYAFLAIIPLLIINKESSILILFFSAIILFSTMRTKDAYTHLFMQGLVAVVSFLLVKSALSGRPGGTVEFHLWGNLRFWTDAKNYLAMMSTSTFFIPVPKPNNILLFPLLIWAISYKWKEKPLIIRRLFVASTVINVPLFILFCYRDEFRNLSLVYPYVYLLACHSITAFHSHTNSSRKEDL